MTKGQTYVSSLWKPIVVVSVASSGVMIKTLIEFSVVSVLSVVKTKVSTVFTILRKSLHSENAKLGFTSLVPVHHGKTQT